MSSATDGFGPFCGALGCTEGAEYVIDHPKHGKRTVCPAHVGDCEVIHFVQ